MKPVNGAKFGYLKVRADKSKNSKSRNVPLSARALQRRKPTSEGNVFLREDGKPLVASLLGQQQKAGRTSLGLPDDFVLHSLRHTFGSRLGEFGADAFTIMKLMGHSSVVVSPRYVHPSPESVERAFSKLTELNDAQGSR